MAVFTFMLKILILLFLFHSVSSAVYTISTLQSLSDDGTTLVSKEGRFELGFFSPARSKNRYVGIWYKNMPVLTAVWVANRCSPINDASGVLMINNVGNLVILYRNTSVVWSTSSSQQIQKPVAELLDSGNLVIREEEATNSENYLWQSFDYPSDTLLPGMKMGWDLRTGLNRSLSAWKNQDDPCPGDFTYGIELYERGRSLPEPIIRQGISKFYRYGPWNGNRFSGSPDPRPNTLFDQSFVINYDEVYYMYHLKNMSVISILVLKQTTLTHQSLSWTEEEQTWSLNSSVPRDLCDNYGLCGANGNCIINQSTVCQCLNGFKPKSPENWDYMDWSEGCVRNNTASCKHKDKDVFVKISNLKLPDSSQSWMTDDIDLEGCRAICLSKCSCMAYTNHDIRGNGSGCAIWFGDLIDVRQFSEGGQDLFIRVRHSEPEKGQDDSKMRAVIVVAVIGGVSGLLLLVYYIFIRGSKEKTGRNKKVTPGNGAKEDDFELPFFSLATISAATDNFSVSNKLGEGGFGPVYKGRLEDGQEIAVKRLSLSSRQGMNEYKTEVMLIAKLQHRNLVKLLGCCIEGEEKLLIYEYMPNKSLDFFIFDQQQSKLLEWPKRFEILCGVARGLQYLHQDSRLRIVHRDLKASNILLDNKMNPKISDFGMAKIFGGDQTEGNTNRIAGTHGYMAPEYAFNGLFSTKSDIFSFGIMVLEIISGKRSIRFHHENHNITLIGQAWTLLNEGRSFELINVHLRDSYNNPSQVLRCIHVGLLCVQQCPEDRPSMSSVILMLGSEGELPQPKAPGYYMETASQERNYVSRKLESFSENTMTITAFGGR